ncbi:MAG: ECF transporter S component [Eubacteriales bacterium]|nr:ECF transporter S component [Eubacteriales bacterium]
MKQTKLDTRYMATLAMFCGVLLVMGVTGIGFIPLPVIKATTMHIPVILGAVLLGPSAGAVLGGVFGLCSIWVNTTTPNLLSFAFSPFMTQEGLPGVLKSLWIALGCRILLGVIAGWLWKLLKKVIKQDYVALAVTAAVSTLCHTILVMGSIYVLLAQQYAEAKNVAITAVFGLVMGTVTASGIPEAIAATILVAVIGKALLHLAARMKNR